MAWFPGFPDPQSGRTQPATAHRRERRAGSDRRQRGTHPLRPASLGGRRHHGRRAADQHRMYVDRYRPAVRYVAIGLLVLSCLDAFLTLLLIQHGGSEINPVMRALLGIDVSAFVYGKLALTAVGVTVLVVHYHFRWLRFLKVAHALYALLAGYCVLIPYEIILLWRAVPA